MAAITWTKLHAKLYSNTSLPVWHRKLNRIKSLTLDLSRVATCVKNTDRAEGGQRSTVHKGRGYFYSFSVYDTGSKMWTEKKPFLFFSRLSKWPPAVEPPSSSSSSSVQCVYIRSKVKKASTTQTVTSQHCLGWAAHWSTLFISSELMNTFHV